MRLPDGGSRYWNDALAFFARTFGDKLLCPITEALDLRAGDKAKFIATLCRQHAHNRAEPDARMIVAGDIRATGQLHFRACILNFLEGETNERRRHHSEVAEGRIAPANIVRVQEGVAELEVFGPAFELGAGVCDGDEVTARIGFVFSVKVALHRQCFEGRPGFRGDDEHRFCKVYRILDVLDGVRIGAIQHQQRRVARLLSESLPQNFGREAAAAHAQQDHMLPTELFAFVAQIFKPLAINASIVGDGQPP